MYGWTLPIVHMRCILSETVNKYCSGKCINSAIICCFTMKRKLWRKLQNSSEETMFLNYDKNLEICSPPITQGQTIDTWFKKNNYIGCLNLKHKHIAKSTHDCRIEINHEINIKHLIATDESRVKRHCVHMQQCFFIPPILLSITGSTSSNSAATW